MMLANLASSIQVTTGNDISSVTSKPRNCAHCSNTSCRPRMTLPMPRFLTPMRKVFPQGESSPTLSFSANWSEPTLLPHEKRGYSGQPLVVAAEKSGPNRAAGQHAHRVRRIAFLGMIGSVVDLQFRSSAACRK